MFPFYLALGLHISYFLVLLFALPESLSPSRQTEARRRHKADGIALLDKESADDDLARESGGSSLLQVRVRRLVVKPFGFLAPLQIFLPKERVEGEEVPILESKAAIVGGKNWNLTKVAASYGAYYMVIAIMQFKIRASSASLHPDSTDLRQFYSLRCFQVRLGTRRECVVARLYGKGILTQLWRQTDTISLSSDSLE